MQLRKLFQTLTSDTLSLRDRFVLTLARDVEWSPLKPNCAGIKTYLVQKFNYCFKYFVESEMS